MRTALSLALLRRSVLALAGAWIGATGASAADPQQTWSFDPLRLYGGDIAFEIRRNGEPIGHHEVQFDQSGQSIDVHSRAELEVSLGLFDYRFEYESKDVWSGGRLESLSATVDDDGDVTDISAWRSGDKLVVNGPNGIADVASEIVPTNHWNPEALTSDLTLNTITGDVVRTSVTKIGEEPIETASGTRIATKYVLELHNDVELWYDLAGHWVGMRFSAADGSTIEYYCLRCGANPTTESAER